MNPVGHVTDGYFARRPAREERLKEAAADAAVQTAHGIHRSASPDRQIGHVEGLCRVVRVLSAQRQQVVEGYAEILLGITPQVLSDKIRCEAVEAGGDRCVRGKEVAGPGDGQRNLKGLPGRLHETACAFQHGERRMPFVQVADFRLDAERGEQPPPADPQDHLLHQAQVRPAAVKLAGDAAIRRKVRCIVAVQQVELQPADLGLPGAQPDRVAGQVELQPQPLAVRGPQRRDRQLSGIVVREERLLRAVLANHLAEIALLVQQPHADDRHAQIAGRLELIAGHVAEPARVDRQGLAQHEFHAEIRDAAERRLRMGLLKPRGRPRNAAP